MKLRRRDDDRNAAATTGGHDDDLVEITRVAFIAEAVAIKQDLDRIGIPSVVFESDAGGWAPHFSIEQGHRVMVRARDVAQAQQLVSECGGQVAIDQFPPSGPVKKHLRRRGEA